MKKIIVLCGENCGYCKKAKMLIKRALEKDPRYQCLDIRFIQDDSQAGKQLKHTLVPAFYCDGTLTFEGNPDMDTVKAILAECCMAD